MHSTDRIELIKPYAAQSMIAIIDGEMVYSIDGKAQPINAVQRLVERLEQTLNRNSNNTEDVTKILTSQSGLDAGFLMTALLSWATSVYRSGHSRVYAFLRLLPSLQQDATAFGTNLIRAICHTACAKSVSTERLGHVVIEMVRGKYLDIGAYLKALVSTGAMYSSETARKVSNLC